MLRFDIAERPNWKNIAKKYGFGYHSMYEDPYWNEKAYYQFTLRQIEEDLEKPTEEIHQMCLDIVEQVVKDEEQLRRFQIPEVMWENVLSSWNSKAPSLYSRLDFAYNGKGTAKLLENNADTPTSLYETGFWQWLWLEDKVDCGDLHRNSDQFNILQEYLMDRFRTIAKLYPGQVLHFSCCYGTEEDRGTVQYLEDCAKECGITTAFVYIEDIGLNGVGEFTDLQNRPIRWMFKLYPWEFMFREEYAESLVTAKVNWFEPMWKSILSNKALLPALWNKFPNHPNLLPAYFMDDPRASQLKDYVIKPIFSREGANISIYKDSKPICESDGPYGDEGAIIQAYHPLPVFAGNHTLVGSWLVNDKAAGISIREDDSLVTQDYARYIPHIILG